MWGPPFIGHSSPPKKRRNRHTAVQPVRSRVLVGLLGRGVAVWVVDAARLAGLDRLRAVPQVDGPGGRRDAEDVADVWVGGLVCLWSATHCHTFFILSRGPILSGRLHVVTWGYSPELVIKFANENHFG